MSYYGVRNLKHVKQADGLWNVECDCYDSSIRDFQGHRVWHHVEKFFDKNFTKAELEYMLFQHFLDGNFHGACGKYAPLSWTNRKVTLSEDNLNLVTTLRKIYMDTPYTDAEKRNAAYKKYSEVRYKLYFEAWKQYLKETAMRKKSSEAYKVAVNKLSWGTIYVKKVTSRHLFYTTDIREVKIFRNTPEEIKAILAKFGVTNYTLISCTEEVEKAEQLKLQLKAEHKDNPRYCVKVKSNYRKDKYMYLKEYSDNSLTRTVSVEDAVVFNTQDKQSILNQLSQVKFLQGYNLKVVPCYK